MPLLLRCMWNYSLIPRTNFQIVFCGLLTATLLWAGWPSGGMAPLLFIALAPLLLVEKNIYEQKKKGQRVRLFGYSYLTYVLFNLLTTWWVWFASPFGMVGAVLANALLMAGVFQVFHWIKLNTGKVFGSISLVIVWGAFEHLHMDWDLSWPWLNLGNGFASWANMVQWYEYTGTLGGTVWIWTSNLIVAEILTVPDKRKKPLIIVWTGLILIPVLLSMKIYGGYEEIHRPVEIVVVQPNVDPYNEKFSGNSDEQLTRMLTMAAAKATPSTKVIVCPETALPDGIWSEELSSHHQIGTIRQFLAQRPSTRLLTGLSYYRYFRPGEALSETARPFRNGEAHFDAYNAAMQMDSTSNIPLHFKSKLVPGVEKMPFPQLLGFMEDFAIDLGGITGSLGVQDKPAVFRGDSTYIAPVICYESIYGDYMGEYVRDGANLICIMTNDGWWRDTPGYKQHCQYARLRAIEHRRSVARSANTGISCFIGQRGEIQDATAWWTPAVIRRELNLNNQLTFYSRFGNILESTFTVLAGIVLTIGALFRYLNYKKQQPAIKKVDYA